MQYHVLSSFGREDEGLRRGTVVRGTFDGGRLWRHWQRLVWKLFTEPSRPCGQRFLECFYVLCLSRNLFKEQDVSFLAVIVGCHLSSLQMLEQNFHGLVCPLMPHAFPGRIPGMILVQTLLDAGLGPIRQRLKGAHIRLLLNGVARLENGCGLFARLLPRTVPDEAALGDFAREHVFLERKVQDIRSKDNASLQQLLESAHLFCDLKFWIQTNITYVLHICINISAFSEKHAMSTLYETGQRV